MFMESALFNMIMMIAPFIIGFLMAILIPGAIRNPLGYSVVAFILYAIGFLLFASAKIRNILKGRIVSFGSANMSTGQKWAYRIGYVLMGISLLIVTAIFITNK